MLKESDKKIPSTIPVRISVRPFRFRKFETLFNDYVVVTSEELRQMTDVLDSKALIDKIYLSRSDGTVVHKMTIHETDNFLHEAGVDEEKILKYFKIRRTVFNKALVRCGIKLDQRYDELIHLGKSLHAGKDSLNTVERKFGISSFNGVAVTPFGAFNVVSGEVSKEKFPQGIVMVPFKGFTSEGKVFEKGEPVSSLL